jgi:wobble nucleotide-excising tRNase
LQALDSLLVKYESEYHYLFDRVYKHSTVAGGGPLEVHYEIPNIARRLLESFLSFRYPSEAGELNQQLEKSKASVATRTRIIRFLHTYSHDGRISEPEHDLSVLAETPAVLRDLLDLIKQEDPAHYAEMEALVGVLAAPDATAVVAAPPAAIGGGP